MAWVYMNSIYVNYELNWCTYVLYVQVYTNQNDANECLGFRLVYEPHEWVH